MVTLGLDTRSLDKQLGRAMGRFRSFGRNMKRQGRTMMRSVTAPLVGIGKEAFTVAKDFEFSMSKVKAVSGATAEEFQRLQANAKELGRTTVFTATDVAGLQLEFSKLGFTATEIEGVTEATLNLAQATDSDLAQAAEVAGATLRGFGMDVSETGHVTDVMAKAFSTSAMDMDSFQDAMKYVAPVAKAAGVSIEDTTAMLGQMANAGIKGSQAGTSLRMIFQQMATGGGDVSERLAQLAESGLTLDAAFDEVGRRAQTALLVMGDGKENIDTMAESFRNADGAAKGMADTMNANAEGATKRMESAIEGAQIAMGSALLPTMESLMQVVTNVATAFTTMDSGMQTTMLIVGAIAAAIGPILVFLPQIVAGFGMVAGVLTGPVVAGIAAVIGAILLIRANWDSIVEYFTNGDGAAMFDSLKQMFVKLVDTVIGIWDFLVSTLQMGWEIFGGFITDNIRRVFEYVIEIFNTAFDVITNVLGVFSALFEGNWSEMFQRILNVVIDTVKLVLLGIEFMISNILSTIDAGLNLLGIESNLNDGFSSIMDGVKEFLDEMKTEFDETESVGSSFFAKIGSGFGLFGGGGGGGATKKPAGGETKPEKSLAIATNIPTAELMTGSAFDISEFLPDETRMQSFFNSFKDELVNSNVLVEQMAANAEAMGNQFGHAFGMIISGAEGGKEAMRGALGNIIDNAFKAATAHAIQAATATGANLGPGALIAIPALIATGMGLVRSVFSSITGFADGGIVSGPVMGLVGEYAGARTNPEVIAPLNKLKSMIGGGQNVVVHGRISGNDILISNERSRNDRTRTRGF